jgi:hypothetical protein
MLDETNALCDRIEAIVNDAKAILQSESFAEKRKQLRELAGVTERLERTGVQVPQELLNLSDSLSHEISQQDSAISAVRNLHARLSELVRETASCVGEPVRHRRRRREQNGCTPIDDYCPVIVEVLNEMGGRALAHMALDEIYDKMSGRLTEHDLEDDERLGQAMWRINAQKARAQLVQDGTLRSDSPKKTWELA